MGVSASRSSLGRDRTVALDVPRMLRRRRLEQQYASETMGDRTMFDTSRHHTHLARGQLHFPIPEFDGQPAIYDEKHFVFLGVRMPDEPSLQLGELYLLTIQLGNDERMPPLVESGEFVRQVDDVDAHGNSLGPEPVID